MHLLAVACGWSPPRRAGTRVHSHAYCVFCRLARQHDRGPPLPPRNACPVIRPRCGLRPTDRPCARCARVGIGCNVQSPSWATYFRPKCGASRTTAGKNALQWAQHRQTAFEPQAVDRSPQVGLQLDLSACARAHAVDRCTALLRERSMVQARVEPGTDQGVIDRVAKQPAGFGAGIDTLGAGEPRRQPGQRRRAGQRRTGG